MTPRRHTPTPWDPLHQSSMPPTDDTNDSDRIAVPEDMPRGYTDRAGPIEEAEFEQREQGERTTPEPTVTLDLIFTEIRSFKTENATITGALAERFTGLQNHVLNAMASLDSLGARALDLEQTIYAAAAMLRTASENQRDDGPDVLRLKTKLLVVAETLGRIAPRKPLDPEAPRLEPGGPKSRRRGG